MPSVPVLVGAAVWPASLVLYLNTLARTLTWGWRDLGVDGGEFLAAASTLGVPHPPGYPTYILILKAFTTVVPIGDFAFRGNLLSAVLASTTVLVSYLAILRLLRHIRPSGPAWLAAAAAALGSATLATSPLFWSQANLTEVYALNALFTSVLFLIALHVVVAPRAADDRLKLGLFGLLLGLGLGNHLTLLAVAVPLALWMWSVLGTRRLLSGWAALGFIVGISVYAYLPLRAAQHPPVNWGEADTIGGLAWMLTGGPYQEYLLGAPARSIASRLVPWLNLVFSQFNPLGIFFGLVGARALLSVAPRLLGAILASMAIVAVYSITYNTVDSEVLMIPWFLVFSVLVGTGLFWIMSTWVYEAAEGGNRIRLGRLKVRPLGQALALGLLAMVLVPGASIALNYGPQDISGDRTAFDHSEAVLAAVPDGSAILTNHEKNAFSLWYMRFVEAPERDVAVVAVPLLQFDWYRRDLQLTFPSIIPELASSDLATTIDTIVRTGGDQGAYFTFNPLLVSDQYGIERQERVWKVTMAGRK